MIPSVVGLAVELSREQAERDRDPVAQQQQPQRLISALHAVTAVLASDVARARALLDELAELLGTRSADEFTNSPG